MLFCNCPCGAIHQIIIYDKSVLVYYKQSPLLNIAYITSLFNPLTLQAAYGVTEASCWHMVLPLSINGYYFLLSVPMNLFLTFYWISIQF